MTIETVAAQHDSSSDSENEQGNASKTERKARKSMLKMGLVPVPGVTRVTIRRTNKVKHFTNETRKQTFMIRVYLQFQLLMYIEQVILM